MSGAERSRYDRPATAAPTGARPPSASRGFSRGDRVSSAQDLSVSGKSDGFRQSEEKMPAKEISNGGPGSLRKSLAAREEAQHRHSGKLSSSAKKGPKNSRITVHVFDEARNLQQDFTCGLTDLLDGMRCAMLRATCRVLIHDKSNIPYANRNWDTMGS